VQLPLPKPPSIKIDAPTWRSRLRARLHRLGDWIDRKAIAAVEENNLAAVRASCQETRTQLAADFHPDPIPFEIEQQLRLAEERCQFGIRFSSAVQAHWPGPNVERVDTFSVYDDGMVLAGVVQRPGSNK